MVTLALLVACDDMLGDERTVVPDLRVLGLVGEPPEVAPGEALTITVHTADPQRVGYDVLVFACTPVDGACVEATAASALALDRFTAVRRAPGSPADATFTVPAELAVLLAEGDATTFFAWALACRPGRCPIIDEVAAAPAPGSPAWEAVVARLADPAGLVAERPLGEAALALRRLVLSTSPPGVRNTNPVIVPVGEVADVAPGGEAVISFAFVDTATAWPFATGGAFEFASYAVSAGAAGMRWYAPDEPGRVELWVAAEDGSGGSAVWAGAVEVR